VTISLIFRAVINRKEHMVAFPCLSLSSHASIHDFWPHLVEKCEDVIGEPEDYEIWEGRHKLVGPLVMGEQYEIIARTTPDRERPAYVSRHKRCSSIDLPNRPLIARKTALTLPQTVPHRHS
jgi:hypothetical protein